VHFIPAIMFAPTRSNFSLDPLCDCRMSPQQLIESSARVMSFSCAEDVHGDTPLVRARVPIWNQRTESEDSPILVWLYTSLEHTIEIVESDRSLVRDFSRGSPAIDEQRHRVNAARQYLR
jgi:hypothetical protein